MKQAPGNELTTQPSVTELGFKASTCGFKENAPTITCNNNLKELLLIFGGVGIAIWIHPRPGSGIKPQCLPFIPVHHCWRSESVFWSVIWMETLLTSLQ